MPKPKDKRRARGNYYQNWCEKFIMKTYPDAIVHNQKSYSKSYREAKTGKLMWMSVRNDIWGCIDLAVILPHSGKPLFIQCTMWTHIQDKLDKIALVPWDLNHVTVQLWTKRQDGRTSIKQLRYEMELIEERKEGNVYRSTGKFELYPIGEIKRGKYKAILEEGG